VYFKNIRISAIGDKLNAFRERRESRERVVEYKQETLTKEIALRKIKAMKDRRKPLSAIEIAKSDNRRASRQDKFDGQTLRHRRIGFAARRARCSDRVIEYLD
jgi:hypothetical protein